MFGGVEEATSVPEEGSFYGETQIPNRPPPTANESTKKKWLLYIFREFTLFMATRRKEIHFIILVSQVKQGIDLLEKFILFNFRLIML